MNLKGIVTFIFVFLSFIFINAQEKSFYDQSWDKVKELEKKSLPQSLFKVVEEIRTHADKEGNTEQYVKAMLYYYRAKFVIKDDIELQETVNELHQDLKRADGYKRSFIALALAKFYKDYLSSNYWKINRRSKVSDYDVGDFKSWDLDAFTTEIKKLFNIAIADDSLLKKKFVKDFKILFKEGNATDLRPTLYDYFVYEYIKYNKSIVTRYNKGKNNKFKNPDFYSVYDKFMKFQLDDTEESSLYINLKLYQDLMKFHGEKGATEAMIHADIKRLKFVNRFFGGNKDGMYMKALKESEKFTDNYHLTPEYRYEMGVYYKNNSSKDKSYNDRAHTLFMEVNDVHYGTRWGNISMDRIEELENPELSFTNERYIGANKSFAVLVNHKNIRDLYINIYKVNRNKLKKINRWSDDYYEKLIANSKPVEETYVPFDYKRDFNKHSSEVILEGLPVGEYVVRMRINNLRKNNMVSYGEIKVSDIACKLNSSLKGTELMVLNRNTGASVSDAKIKVKPGYRGNYKKSKTYYTGKDGKVLISQNSSAKIDVSWRNNSLDFHTYLSKMYDYNKPSTNTYYYTDRSIYRPGQTVMFKGLRVNKDGDVAKPMEYEDLIVSLYDVNGKKISSIDVRTNNFGSFKGEFVIPKNLLNGQMSIRDDRGGSFYFRVEEYKRPKFYVTLNDLQGEYMLNDSVKITGNAMTYSGVPLSYSKVKFSVNRKPIFRWYHYERLNFGATQISLGELTTDSKGNFTVMFKAKSDDNINEKGNISYYFDISADVTDITGETHSGHKSVKISQSPVFVETIIKSAFEKSELSIAKAKIEVTNSNGIEVAGKGSLEVYEIVDKNLGLKNRIWDEPDMQIYNKKEWDKIYSGNIYKKEKPERKKIVFKSEFDTSDQKDIDISGFGELKNGQYLAVSTILDKNGKKVVDEKRFVILDKKSDKIPFEAIDFFEVLKGKALPGESAEFLIGSSKNVFVRYILEDDQKIITDKVIKIKSGNQKLISIPITEEHRGGISVNFSFIYNNRSYMHSHTIKVPYDNKKLNIEFTRIRKKLQPGESTEITYKITDYLSNEPFSESALSLYDASLDAINAHNWSLNLYPEKHSSIVVRDQGFRRDRSRQFNTSYPRNRYSIDLDRFNWYGFGDDNAIFCNVRRRPKRFRSNGSMLDEMVSIEMEEEADESPQSKIMIRGTSSLKKKELGYVGGVGELEKPKQVDLSNIKVRSNFNETAFFYPQLKSDRSGKVTVKFTVPESTTKWRLLGLTHTRSLEYSVFENSLVTQKDFMVTPHLPRFFREGDRVVVTTKIQNLSEESISGVVSAEFYDLITDNKIAEINVSNLDFNISAKSNDVLKWRIEIPENLSAVRCIIKGAAGKLTDGEEHIIPVLSNRKLITESMPFDVRKKGKTTFKFRSLSKNKSKTLRHHKLTLEYTSNPVWSAILSLPYMIEYPYECAEQTFNRYYANLLASYIVKSNPKIEAVFNKWRNLPNSSALISKLEQNEELKEVLMNQTPWVIDARNESEAKKRIAMLFDANKMSNELSVAFRKLKDMQNSSGAWPWFEGMNDSRYITQYILSGVGHLIKLKALDWDNNFRFRSVINKAIDYSDEEMYNDYKRILALAKRDTTIDMNSNHLNSTIIQYMYMRSFFDRSLNSKHKKAFGYFMSQVRMHWTAQNLYSRAMSALILKRNKINGYEDIVKSIKEHSIKSKDMGVHWKYKSGFYWYHRPIETQSLLIEMFKDLTPEDKDFIADMKLWILKNKQTNNWETTKASSEAIFALLYNDSDYLTTEVNDQIKVGKNKINLSKSNSEAGTGYFKTFWTGKEVKKNMSKVTITKQKDGISWGALHWQYTEEIDNIKVYKDTPLKITKELYKEVVTDSGVEIVKVVDSGNLKTGDKLVVRIIIDTDRDMEYVHMQDMRASAFEPVDALSGYKYGGTLGYYQSVKDASVDFFIDRLRKGKHLFEYKLKVVHSGDFSNGVTTMQCMYAPEFNSHSESVRVVVE